ncbi:MAG TPA: succinyldiaminopimelate transaminase, partial [Kiloniellales bacterium]|nr:succinyldiaminopimelate transaminase [Kiloniellales bacterium]
MNPDLDRLRPYPFERLAALFEGVRPAADRTPIALSIGEPGHAPPALAGAAIEASLAGLGRYPATRGSDELRGAIADWLQARYGLEALSADEQVLPVNGTREALFAFAQAVVDRRRGPTVVLPNPFYQIYEGAALLAGAEPVYVPLDGSGLADFDRLDASAWERCQLLYLCSPGNPSGAVLGMTALQRLIERAHAHDFVIAADECYAELYADEAAPPPGLLQAARQAGYPGFDRCVVFHSLSKRSSLPGLRSGFVAGDADILARFARYRTYHGCAMAPPLQAASVAAWRDEAHVHANRAAYRAKFDQVLSILEPALPVARPAGG